MGKFIERIRNLFTTNKGKIVSGAKKASFVLAIVPIALSVVACTDKTPDQDLDQDINGPAIENPVGGGQVGGDQTGTQTPSTPSTPDVPVTPDTPDVPVTPDTPDVPVTPDVPDVPDVPVTPEKTEAEYKVECEERMLEAVEAALKTKYTRGTISNVEIAAINLENGKIYANADYSRTLENHFYEISTNLTKEQSFKAISESLENFEILNIEDSTNIKSSVSEEKYNELCEYVLGEVGLEGAEVLNATTLGAVGSMDGTTLTAIKNGKVYEISAKSHSGTASGAEDKINYMLNSSTNEIEITNEENFEDFDMIGISLENLSFEQEIGGEEVSMKFVKGANEKYSLDFNFCSFGDDGFGF